MPKSFQFFHVITLQMRCHQKTSPPNLCACRFGFVPIEKSHNGAKLHQRYAQLSKHKWRHSIYSRKAQFKLRANLCRNSKVLTFFCSSFLAWSISAHALVLKRHVLCVSICSKLRYRRRSDVFRFRFRWLFGSEFGFGFELGLRFGFGWWGCCLEPRGAELPDVVDVDGAGCVLEDCLHHRIRRDLTARGFVVAADLVSVPLQRRDVPRQAARHTSNKQAESDSH